MVSSERELAPSVKPGDTATARISVSTNAPPQEGPVSSELCSHNLVYEYTPSSSSAAARRSFNDACVESDSSADAGILTISRDARVGVKIEGLMIPHGWF